MACTILGWAHGRLRLPEAPALERIPLLSGATAGIRFSVSSTLTQGTLLWLSLAFECGWSGRRRPCGHTLCHHTVAPWPLPALPFWPLRSLPPTTTGNASESGGRFRITHPFHPLVGTEYEMIAHQRNWGEDRIIYYDANGRLNSFLANVTDRCSIDAFGRVSAGRSAFRFDDLLELRELLDRHNDTARVERNA